MMGRMPARSTRLSNSNSRCCEGQHEKEKEGTQRTTRGEACLFFNFLFTLVDREVAKLLSLFFFLFFFSSWVVVKPTNKICKQLQQAGWKRRSRNRRDNQRVRGGSSGSKGAVWFADLRELEWRLCLPTQSYNGRRHGGCGRTEAIHDL